MAAGPDPASVAHAGCARKPLVSVSLQAQIAGVIYTATYLGHGHLKTVFLLSADGPPYHNKILKITLEKTLSLRSFPF